MLQLKKKLRNSFTLHLQINIDGLPLFKSSNTQIWLILGLVTNMEMKVPIIIGLFSGVKKPSSSIEYLKEFAEDLKNFNLI